MKFIATDVILLVTGTYKESLFPCSLVFMNALNSTTVLRLFTKRFKIISNANSNLIVEGKQMFGSNLK